jgi:hypothetical protein
MLLKLISDRTTKPDEPHLIAQQVTQDNRPVDHRLRRGQQHRVLHQRAHNRIQELVRNLAQSALDIHRFRPQGLHFLPQLRKSLDSGLRTEHVRPQQLRRVRERLLPVGALVGPNGGGKGVVAVAAKDVDIDVHNLRGE